MLKNKLKIIQTGTFLITCCILFIYSIHPVVSFDTFFGLRIGEWILSHHAVPLHEQFSWAAYGRSIVPYEWLAQVIVYLLFMIGSFKALELYVALMLVAFFVISFAFTFKVVKRDFLSSYLLSLFLAVSLYEFFVARPQIIAFTCLIATIALILHYILNHKNYLIWSLGITYLWTNSHASFIFITFLFFSYAVLSFLYFRLKKDSKTAYETAKTLLVFGVVNFLVTFFPPLWGKPYVLLWDFSRDITFMTQFVSEWGSLTINPTYQIFYTILVVFTLLLSGLFTFRNKKFHLWLLALPLVAITLASFQALRHVPLGSITSISTLSLFLPHFSFKKWGAYSNTFLTLLILCLIIWMGIQKKAPIYDTIWKIPSATIDQDISSIKSMHLRGRMFNEFAIGGYFVYYLYPEYKIFFDGRADIYHCCEMRNFWTLVQAKKDSPTEFNRQVHIFLNKYHFSYLLVPTYSYNPLEFNTTTLMVNTLLDDPDWRLIYVSDFIQIMVKNDGKNTHIFNEMGMTSVAPYRYVQYKGGHADQALVEYQKAVKYKDSAIVRNALGELYLQKNNITEAQKQFVAAVRLNSLMGRAYAGLGKIALKKNNVPEAIDDFNKAFSISPYWGETYFLLGTTYHQLGKDDKAVFVLNKALKQNIDFISLKKVVQLLNSIQQ